MLEEHLGGHNNKTHIDIGALTWLQSNFNIKTFLDIGCGPGGMVQAAEKLGVSSYGIDGDYTLERYNPNKFLIHDFTKGPAPLTSKYDIGWSVEFLEHVYEQYQDNYMQDFIKGKYALITFAPPGKPGHHHVNCKNPEYWIEVFKKYGFEYDEERTKHIREISTMFTTKKNKKTGELMKRHQFVKENGMLFVKV